jgi:hypothetical protein
MLNWERKDHVLGSFLSEMTLNFSRGIGTSLEFLRIEGSVAILRNQGWQK